MWIDSATEDESPASQVEALAFEHHVAAILGPLLKDRVMEAAQTAQRDESTGANRSLQSGKELLVMHEHFR